MKGKKEENQFGVYWNNLVINNKDRDQSGAVEVGKKAQMEEIAFCEYQQDYRVMECGNGKKEAPRCHGIPGSASNRIRRVRMSWWIRGVNDELDFRHVEAKGEAGPTYRNDQELAGEATLDGLQNPAGYYLAWLR